MRSSSIRAIVLRRHDLAERDRILTVFAKETGKISAVAKGARRPGSKLSGSTEPGTYSKMLVSAGRNLDVIGQVEIVESFPGIRREIGAVAHMVYLLELTNQFTEERVPNPDLFDTLLSALYVLEGGTDPEITARYFELHLLSNLGYSPRFDSCLRCGRETRRQRVAFSPSTGGVVCLECGSPPEDSIYIPGAAASWVRAVAGCEPHRLRDLTVPPAARRDLARTLKWHIRYRLEHDLKSAEFIEAVREFDGLMV